MALQPADKRPIPQNRVTRDTETRLNLTPTQKNEVLEKLAELQKKEKGEAPNRVDHPLQITRVLSDFFGDQIRYYEYGKGGKKSNKKDEGPNWSRRELIQRRKCFIKDYFHEFYKGEKVLFDPNGHLLDFLMTHYEHCEERFGGILLHRDNAGKFNAIVQMKAKGKDFWTLPKGCRNLYTFNDNHNMYMTNLPVNQRLVPSSDPEGDLQVAVRETRQGTGIPEDILNKHVQGYFKVENGIYEIKFFVIILIRRNVKPGDWDTNHTEHCKWIEWQFNNIDWGRLQDIEGVQLLPYQDDTIRIEDFSGVFQKCFYFLKNLEQVIWTASPPRDSANLFANLKEKEAAERRKAEKKLPPLEPITTVSSTTNRQNKLADFTFMEALDLDELNSTQYSNNLLFSANQLKSKSRISNMPGTSSNRSLQQAQSKNAQTSNDSLITSRTQFHEKPSHHNQPSLIDFKALYEAKWKKPPKFAMEEDEVHHD